LEKNNTIFFFLQLGKGRALSLKFWEIITQYYAIGEEKTSCILNSWGKLHDCKEFFMWGRHL
jgi:hypothetical protein